jgi:hypothetical protein
MTHVPISSPEKLGQVKSQNPAARIGLLKGANAGDLPVERPTWLSL